MRKSRQEAAQTREKILHTAVGQFNERGVEGSAVADIMKAAGLTHGGFYKHFSSKEQLVAEAVEQSLHQVFSTLESPGVRKSLETMVGEYLSARHRDEPAIACPLAALGTELRYANEEVRNAASKGIEHLIELIQEQLPDLPPREARRQARGTVAAMAGAIMLSRILQDKRSSDSMLRDTKAFLLKR